ncbi:MAG: DUF790 family protein [Pseudomonadota bacterium]
MITGPLLRARCTRDEVAPSLVDPDSPRYREAAEALVGEARAAAEAQLTRGELEARIEERIVGNRVDHKLLRGLARVLTDRCTFDTQAPLPPMELRQRLFARGPVRRQPDVSGTPTAADHVSALAEQLGTTPEAIARGLFADLKENQILLESPVTSAEWLLHRYNLALVQGLLLHATRVEITLAEPGPKPLRMLFRQIKFHGLMYAIQPEGAAVRVTLDGPASLFSLSTRYGMALAQIVPALPHQTGPWRLEAELNYRHRRRPMVLDHTVGLRSHTEATGAWVSREEAWFEERFLALDSGWELAHGGEVVNLGGEAVIIPDFTFTREGRTALLEVVGVWRRGYLERRLDLLRRHGRPDLILAVSRTLLGDKGKGAGDLGAEVVPFSSAIPARKVLELVEKVAR